LARLSSRFSVLSHFEGKIGQSLYSDTTGMTSHYLHKLVLVWTSKVATNPELRRGRQAWFDRYNHWRPHENLTPAHVYRSTVMTSNAA